MPTKPTRTAALAASAAALAAFTLAGTAHAQAQSGSVEVNGAKIAYRVQGHGPVLMLIHGYPLSGELFAKNRSALARRYTVVTPDLRGFGDSVAPDTNGSVQIYAKDMLGVMDHLHVQKAIIGGMSMGGPVVLEMYREAPQRFRGMVLIDSTSFPAGPPEKGQWPGFGKLSAQKGTAAMIPILMPQMLTTKTRMGDPALVSFVGGIVKKCSVKGAIGGGSTLANRPDSRPTLGGVKVPVLLVVGMDDPLYAVEMQKMMKASNYNAKLAVIPGAAHAAIIEKPEACNRAIESWANGLR